MKKKLAKEVLDILGEDLRSKKVRFDIYNASGNEYAISLAFEKQAKVDGWTKDEIKAVLEKAQNELPDFHKFIITIAAYCR